MPFYFGYETKQGYLYDQHAPAYEDFLLAAFPEFSDRLSVGDSEGMHSIELHDDEDPRQLWAVFVKRFEQLGVVQMGTPAGDRKVVLSTDDPILGKPAGAAIVSLRRQFQGGYPESARAQVVQVLPPWMDPSLGESAPGFHVALGQGNHRHECRDRPYGRCASQSRRAGCAKGA